MRISRRESFRIIGGASLVGYVSANSQASDRERLEEFHIASNTFPWMTFADREDREIQQHTDSLLAAMSSTEINGYEPIVDTSAELEGLAAVLERHGLEMRSLYLEGVFHDSTVADQDIARIVSIAQIARDLGAKIIVTNPAPINWDAVADKSDQQLREQARALDKLGGQLRDLGLVLAYHNHDMELRHGGREFHHMLASTDPANVKLCLEAHWIYRGCGDSEVAVFDALAHYYPRVVELHLRQSTDGVWNEVFSMQGDIDYVRLFEFLKARGIAPHLVLEQAVESESTKNMTARSAHRQSCHHLRRYLS